MRLELRFLQPGETDHELVWSLVGATSLLLAAATLVVVGVPPTACAFRAVTGWPCPTCGGSRVVLALATGDALGALRLNPAIAGAILLFPAYAAYGLSVAMLGLRRVRLVLDSRDRQLLRLLAACALAALWGFLVADRR